MPLAVKNEAPVLWPRLCLLMEDARGIEAPHAITPPALLANLGPYLALLLLLLPLPSTWLCQHKGNTAEARMIRQERDHAEYK